MPHPVFISYARKTSRELAEGLHRELGGETGLAFLDTSDIEAGEKFPRVLVDALLDAKVIAIFADETYFKRWYCLRELRTALAPFEALLRRGTASDKQSAAALSHLVVALPQRGAANLLDNLPPLIRQASWPSADQTATLAQLVTTRLSSIDASICEHIGSGREADAIRATLLGESALPPPMNLAGVTQFPLVLPVSLGEGFVGRADDLWRIHFALSTMRGEPATSAALSGALEGGSGFGKTRLALEYLHRFGGHYPGGLFWIDADVSEEALQERFHGILREVKPETPDVYALREQFRQTHKDDPDGFAKDLKRRLAEALHALPPERPLLFVVDNVPEAPAGIQPKPLDNWCPAVGKVAVLATSRARLLGMPGLKSLPVDTLDRKSAVALLTQDGVDRGSMDESSWDRIAEWVGDLPLPLELLQQSLKAGAISPHELFDLADKQAGPAAALDSQMAALRGQVPAASLRGVTEALKISYEKLSEKTQKAARLFAFLSPDPVPLEIIGAVGAEVFAPDAKAALVTRSFVTQLPTGAAIPWFGRMHRVLADFLRNCSPEPEHEALAMCKAIINVMQPHACRDPNRWPLMNACLPHAEWLFGRVGAAKSREFGETTIRLGLRVGILLSAEGLPGRARTTEESTLSLAQSLLGEEHPDTLTSMNNLAGTLRAYGDLARARKLQERALEVRRRVLDEDHPDTLISMNNLATTLYAQGELAGACKLQERALEVRRRVLGEEHPDTLASMINLAGTLRAQGDLAGACKLQERALEVCRRVLGEDHPTTLASMNNLALTLHAQGDLAGARELHERALEVRRRILGEEHPDTLASMNNLAATLHAQGDLAGARKLQERALEVHRRMLGEEHSDTLALMNNLAATLHAQSDLAGARKLHERALEVRRRVLGEEHPDTLASMNNLAETLRAQGDLAGARKLHDRTLEGRRGVLGEEHPDTLTSMNNLALTLHAQGHLAGARELHERALEDRRRVLDEQHPDTLTSMDNLAATLHAQGDLAGARELQERALEDRRRVLGEEHPNTLTSMDNLAATLRAQGDLAGARKLQERALEVHRRALGEEHPNTLALMNNLAATLHAQGDLASARKLHERALEVRRRVLGEEHPDTLTSMNNLGATLHAQGDLAGARKLHERTFEVRRRVLGEEHPDTLTSMSNLAATLHAQGDLAGARELDERTLEVRRRVLGEEHPDTLLSMNNLAETLRAHGDLASARELNERMLEVRRRVLGEEHPDTLISMNNLALTLRALGDLAGSGQLQERTLEVSRRVLGGEHPITSLSAWNLSQTLAQFNETAASEKIVHDRLIWLLERDPATLDANQRQIRGMLQQV